MTETLGALAGQTTPFIGRQSERGALLDLLEPDGPSIVFLHGLAGVGKSSLLRAFAAEAAAADFTVVTVDGEGVEPTEAGFMRALGVEDIAAAAATLDAAARPVVLLLDTYERLRLLDDWLRRVLVPSLPAHIRILIAGRDAPVAAWRSRYGAVLRVLELDSLSQTDAVTLLERLGVAPGDAVAVNRVVRGHPLSLHLAAAVRETGPISAVAELERIYLAGLDGATRGALDAASVVRRVTLPLLGAMLADGTVGDAFARLRHLPFVTLGADGLVLHHVMREAVAAELRAVDPARHRCLRAAAWRHLRQGLGEARDAELWRLTADMLYLLEKPAVRDAFFPTQAQLYSVEPAGSRDAGAIAAIAERHEPPAGATQARAWWTAAPEAFFVARDAKGEVAGFSAVARPAEVPTRLLDGDPVAAAWRVHLRGDPLPRDRTALFIRFMCGGESGERPAPDVAALYLDLKRTYLKLRPGLRRLYTCAHEIQAMGPTLEPLGFSPLDTPPVLLDGVRYEVYCNDFGPAGVEGWLARLAADDVLGDDAPLLDEDRRQLTLDGERIDLTPLEFGVVECLAAHPDAVVRRETLLREVWGAEWDTAGNALESVVSTLRRKLGGRAGALETVRGVGYRLRPPA